MTVKAKLAWLLAGGAALAMPATGLAQPGNPNDDDRCNIAKKGSLLVFPYVSVKWKDFDGSGTYHVKNELIEDTFISMTNDHDEDGVDVKLYFVNGDGPCNEPTATGTRVHKGWNNIDAEAYLTKENPAYFSVLTGKVGLGKASDAQPLPSFLALDSSSTLPGRPDPECYPPNLCGSAVPAGCNVRVLRGFILAWASDPTGDYAKHWNHLSGLAHVVNYEDGTVAEYSAYAFQALFGNEGDIKSNDGYLYLNGTDFDYAPDRLVFEFTAADNVFGDHNPIFDRPNGTGIRNTGTDTFVSTDLALMILDIDFTQGLGAIPPSTSASYDDTIHIGNCPSPFGASGICDPVTCWAQIRLLDENFGVPGNPDWTELVGNTVIQGGNQCCSLCQDRAMLGVRLQSLSFTSPAKVARTLISGVPAGTQSATIKYNQYGGGQPVKAEKIKRVQAQTLEALLAKPTKGRIEP